MNVVAGEHASRVMPAHEIAIDTLTDRAICTIIRSPPSWPPGPVLVPLRYEVVPL